MGSISDSLWYQFLRGRQTMEERERLCVIEKKSIDTTTTTRGCAHKLFHSMSVYQFDWWSITLNTTDSKDHSSSPDNDYDSFNQLFECSSLSFCPIFSLFRGQSADIPFNYANKLRRSWAIAKDLKKFLSIFDNSSTCIWLG